MSCQFVPSLAHTVEGICKSSFNTSKKVHYTSAGFPRNVYHNNLVMSAMGEGRESDDICASV